METGEEIRHRATFTVRAAETDFTRSLTLPGLMRIFHEASLQHVLRLGLSVWHLERFNASWVLLRKEIHITRMPVLGETIEVETYPSGADRQLTYRDFLARDNEGKLLATASTSWLLMEMSLRKMMAIPDEILAPISQHFPSKDQCLPRPGGKFGSPDPVAFNWQAKVGWFDLDFNDHLNNVTYAAWMLHALPENFLRAHTLNAFAIRYAREAVLHDPVFCRTGQGANGEFLHQLTRGEDGEELALGRSNWTAT